MIYKKLIYIGFMFISTLNHAMTPHISWAKNNHQKRTYCTQNHFDYNIETLNTCVYKSQSASRYPKHVVSVQQYFQQELEKEAISTMNLLCAFWQVTPEQLKKKFAHETYLKKQKSFYPVSKELENKVRVYLEPEFKSIDLGINIFDCSCVMSNASANSIIIPYSYRNKSNWHLKKYLNQSMGHMVHQDYVMPDDGDNEDMGYDWTRVLPNDVKNFLRKRAELWAWTRSAERALSGVSFYRKLYPDAIPHERCEDQAFDCKMLKSAEQVYRMLSDELLNEREGR